MAERKLTKSEQALKIRDPEAFAERMKRKKGRRPLTAKTIRDAGQEKVKQQKLLWKNVRIKQVKKQQDKHS